MKSLFHFIASVLSLALVLQAVPARAATSDRLGAGSNLGAVFTTMAVVPALLGQHFPRRYVESRLTYRSLQRSTFAGLFSWNEARGFILTGESGDPVAIRLNESLERVLPSLSEDERAALSWVMAMRIKSLSFVVTDHISPEELTMTGRRVAVFLTPSAVMPGHQAGLDLALTKVVFTLIHQTEASSLAAFWAPAVRQLGVTGITMAVQQLVPGAFPFLCLWDTIRACVGGLDEQSPFQDQADRIAPHFSTLKALGQAYLSTLPYSFRYTNNGIERLHLPIPSSDGAAEKAKLFHGLTGMNLEDFPNAKDIPQIAVEQVGIDFSVRVVRAGQLVIIVRRFERAPRKKRPVEVARFIFTPGFSASGSFLMQAGKQEWPEPISALFQRLTELPDVAREVEIRTLETRALPGAVAAAWDFEQRLEMLPQGSRGQAALAKLFRESLQKFSIHSGDLADLLISFAIIDSPTVRNLQRAYDEKLTKALNRRKAWRQRQVDAQAIERQAGGIQTATERRQDDIAVQQAQAKLLQAELGVSFDRQHPQLYALTQGRIRDLILRSTAVDSALERVVHSPKTRFALLESLIDHLLDAAPQDLNEIDWLTSILQDQKIGFTDAVALTLLTPGMNVKSVNRHLRQYASEALEKTGPDKGLSWVHQRFLKQFETDFPRAFHEARHALDTIFSAAQGGRRHVNGALTVSHVMYYIHSGALNLNVNDVAPYLFELAKFAGSIQDNLGLARAYIEDISKELREKRLESLRRRTGPERVLMAVPLRAVNAKKSFEGQALADALQFGTFVRHASAAQVLSLKDTSIFESYTVSDLDQGKVASGNMLGLQLDSYSTFTLRVDPADPFNLLILRELRYANPQAHFYVRPSATNGGRWELRAVDADFTVRGFISTMIDQILREIRLFLGPVDLARMRDTIVNAGSGQLTFEVRAHDSPEETLFNDPHRSYPRPLQIILDPVLFIPGFELPLRMAVLRGLCNLAFDRGEINTFSEFWVLAVRRFGIEGVAMGFRYLVPGATEIFRLISAIIQRVDGILVESNFDVQSEMLRRQMPMLRWLVSQYLRSLPSQYLLKKGIDPWRGAAAQADPLRASPPSIRQAA